MHFDCMSAHRKMPVRLVTAPHNVDHLYNAGKHRRTITANAWRIEWKNRRIKLMQTMANKCSERTNEMNE